MKKSLFQGPTWRDFFVIIFAIFTIKINQSKSFNRPMFLYNLSWNVTSRNHFLYIQQVYLFETTSSKRRKKKKFMTTCQCNIIIPK